MSCPRPRALGWTTSEWLRNMRIRELQQEDLATRVQWMNDPRVYGSMHFDVPIVMENTIRWFERNRGNATRSDVVFTDDKDRIVGFGGLTSISESPRMAELYVFVNPASQQRGLGTQATLLLCQWGFARLGLHKIYLLTNEDNAPAIGAYEKCGFRLEGRHRGEYLDTQGVLKDRLYFGLLRSEFGYGHV